MPVFKALSTMSQEAFTVALYVLRLIIELIKARMKERP